MDYQPTDYPPMPGYGGQQQPYGQQGDQYYNSSVGTLPEDQHYDDNDYGSTANLALSAAPMAGPDDPRMGQYPDAQPRHQQQQSQGYMNDPYGYAQEPQQQYRGPAPVGGGNGAGGVAYGQAYTADVPYGSGSDAQHESGAAYQQPHHQQQQSYGYGQGGNGNGQYDYGAGQGRAM